MVAVDTQRGPAEGRRQMGETGVQAHHLLRARQHGGHLAHLQEGRHVAVAAGRNALGQRLLVGAAPANHRLPAQFQHAPAHRHPVPLGPVFLFPAGVGNDQRVGVAGQPGGRGRPQAEVGRRVRHGVAQVGCHQPAAAFHGLQLPRHGSTPGVQPGRRGFADAGAVVAHHRGLRLAGPHRALQQPLQVQHEVVALVSKLLAERADRRPGAAAEQLPAPLAPGYGQHPPQARVHLRNGREHRFHQPVDLDARKVGVDIGHHRQRVDHVAHRRGLDDQDARGAQGD